MIAASGFHGVKKRISAAAYSRFRLYIRKEWH